MSEAPDDEQSFLNRSAAIQYRLLPLSGNLALEFGGISIEVVNSQTIRKKPPRQCHTNVDIKSIILILPIMSHILYCVIDEEILKE